MKYGMRRCVVGIHSLSIGITILQKSEYLLSEMGIQEELKINFCKRCRTRTEPTFSQRKTRCPICHYIMINMTVAEFLQNQMQFK
jgi:hypothetical protein